MKPRINTKSHILHFMHVTTDCWKAAITYGSLEKIALSCHHDPMHGFRLLVGRFVPQTGAAMDVSKDRNTVSFPFSPDF